MFRKIATWVRGIWLRTRDNKAIIMYITSNNPIPPHLLHLPRICAFSNSIICKLQLCNYYARLLLYQLRYTLSPPWEYLRYKVNLKSTQSYLVA